MNDSTFPWEGKHIILLVVFRWLQSEGKRQQQFSVLTFFVWEESLDIQYRSLNPNVRTQALEVNDSTFPRKLKFPVLTLVLQIIICLVERHASKTLLFWSLYLEGILGHTQHCRWFTKLCVWFLKWNESAFTWEGKQLTTDYKLKRGGKCQQDFSALVCLVWEQCLELRCIQYWNSAPNAATRFFNVNGSTYSCEGKHLVRLMALQMIICQVEVKARKMFSSKTLWLVIYFPRRKCHSLSGTHIRNLETTSTNKYVQGFLQQNRCLER